MSDLGINPTLSKIKAFCFYFKELIQKMSNTDSITLTGSTLDYWFHASSLIQTLAEIDGITEDNLADKTLTLTREMFAGSPGGATDWRLLKDLVEMRKIGNMGPQGLINRFNETKGYSREQVTKFLDYLAFKTARTALPNLARELQVAPHGARPGEAIAATNRNRPLGNRPAPRTNGHYYNNYNGEGYNNYNNYNNYNENNNDEAYYQSRRRLEREAEEEELGKHAAAASKFLRRTNRNNNNNRPPKGKRRGGKKSTRKSSTRKNASATKRKVATASATKRKVATTRKAN